MKSLAPEVGFEPTTFRLTAECSTVELLRSNFLYLTTPHFMASRSRTRLRKSARPFRCRGVSSN